MQKLHARQTGFTYLAALFMIAVVGIAIASVGLLWSTVSKRAKEQDLLFVGGQLRSAIGQYYERSPGTNRKYPASLTDLLKDERQLATQRYLRKIYRDPITKSLHWGVIRAPDGGIMGVYSMSEEKPLKRGGFREADRDFEGSQHYSEWKFVYQTSTIPSVGTSKAILPANH